MAVHMATISDCIDLKPPPADKELLCINRGPPQDLRRTGLHPIKRLRAAAAEEEDKLSAGKKKKGEQQMSIFYHAKRDDIQASILREQDLHITSRPRALVALLKSCAKRKDLHRGSQVHADIVRLGLLEKNVFIGSSLVNMYARCGSLAQAQEVFDELPHVDVVSWNALMSGYAQHGHGKQVLQCFEPMQLEGFSANAVTFVCILKACGSIGAVDKGKEIHADIVKQGLLKKNVIVGNALMDMYVKCGMLANAQVVFEELPVRDVVSWSVLVAGFADHGLGEQAIKCFKQMQLEGLSPNAITFVCILKACGSLRAADTGKYIHADIVRKGLLEKNIVLGTALIDMYAKCGLLTKAQEVFDVLPSRNVVSWNALMAGYTQYGHAEQALKCFDQMQFEGPSPDEVTYLCVLRACGCLGAAERGTQIHTKLVREGLLTESIALGNALVDMYAKCGLVAKAQEVFDKLLVRTVVSWNSLMTGLVQLGHGEQALKCFEQMQREGHVPDTVTFACMLKACGSIGALEKGKEMHAKIVIEGSLLRDDVIGTALVDMYAKCGQCAEAKEVFFELPVQNVVSWNALIAGYAMVGNTEHVFFLLDKMIQEGIHPDVITFATVLNCCSHNGLLDKAQLYFKVMCRNYDIVATLKHHNCLADAFARAGHLDKAVAMIKQMPLSADFCMWLTVMNACQKWRDTELGRVAYDFAMHLGGKEAAAYVCMSNIYAMAGVQVDVCETKDLSVEEARILAN